LDAISDGSLAEAFPLGVGVHSVAGFRTYEAREFAGILGDTVVGKRGRWVGIKYAVHWTNHGADRNPEGFREIEVALIVRGHGHDGSRAIVDQHKVTDPDGDFLAAIRIDGVVAGEDAVLGDVSGAHLLARINHVPGLGAAGVIEKLLRERVFGGQDHAGGAVNGVDSRADDANFIA